MRLAYPRWGKDKLRVLLQREGLVLSVSMVGRSSGASGTAASCGSPPDAGSAPGSGPGGGRTPCASPRARGRRPGDLVQVDTLDVRPLPGLVLKQFTARDVVSRWDVLELRTSASARSAVAILDALGARMPFGVRALSVDNGSEFMAEFEQACAERGIALLTLPPRSPKLNGCVERANRTHTEEFYEITDAEATLADLRPALLAWETTYNTIRPHQALGYLTPAEYLVHQG